ncbi:hypothetical protein AAVH_11453, partial [Aphelenchoides avenae]
LSKCRYCLHTGQRKRQTVVEVDLDQFNFFQTGFEVADCADFVSDMLELARN